MFARLISVRRLAAKPRDAVFEPRSDVPASGPTGREDEERYLMAAAESMLRAGYGHQEIERALRRMSAHVPRRSSRLGIFGSLRRALTGQGRSGASVGQPNREGSHEARRGRRPASGRA